MRRKSKARLGNGIVEVKKESEVMLFKQGRLPRLGLGRLTVIPSQTRAFHRDATVAGLPPVQGDPRSALHQAAR